MKLRIDPMSERAFVFMRESGEQKLATSYSYKFFYDDEIKRKRVKNEGKFSKLINLVKEGQPRFEGGLWFMSFNNGCIFLV